MSKNDKIFAIVGGGSTGPLQLITLALEAQREGINLNGYEFHLIDPDGFGNGGIAYGQSLDGQILNSVCSEMDPHNRGGFIRSLESRGVDVHPALFNERSGFVPFIREDMVGRAIDILETLGATIIEHEKAAFVRRDNDGSFSLVDSDPADTANNPQLVDTALTGLSADNFVLTVGYGPNTNFEHLHGRPGYVHNIYDKHRRPLEEREPRLYEDGVRIAIAGSGPGLKDVTNALKTVPGELHVFSGSGKPLRARDVSVEEHETSIPPVALLALNETSTLDDAKKALSAEFNENAFGRSSRRVALDINRHLRDILESLPLDVAIGFRLSEEFAEVKHLATPVPQESLDRLEELGAQYHKARLNGNITPLPDGTFAINANGQTFIADVIINATGQGQHNAPIIESLKRQGLAAVDERTGVLATDSSNYESAQSGIRIIGPATHVGTHGIESFYPYTLSVAKDFVRQARTTQDNAPIQTPFRHLPVPRLREPAALCV